MKIKNTRDSRSRYRRIMDFLFGEKLTKEEIKKQENLMMKAHCFMLGAGGGATGKVEIISMEEERKKENKENNQQKA